MSKFGVKLSAIPLTMLMAACGPSGGGGSGTAGTSGSAGVSGSAGMTGSAGTSGSAGVSGSAGTTGSAGSVGPGSAGTSGSAGASGTTGSGGTTGAAGNAGTAGSGGSTGTAGRGGTTGSAGTTGTAGTGGVAGARGGSGGATGTAGAGGRGGTTGTGGSTCAPPAAPTPSGADWINGSLVNINDNGAWTWYSDERAVVDTARGKLIVSSDANSMGPSGSSRNGDVDAVIWDLATRTQTSRTALQKLNPDDHNNAGLLVRPDGNYLAMYAGHNQDCKSYWRNYNVTTSTWTAAQSFDWVPLGCDLSVNTKVTYSNPWNMTAESKIYAFVRSVGTSPNALVSSDQGMTWTYGGRLTSTPTVGYVAGYYKYWGNGVDRIDFVGTEAHPRDFDNSLYHGYIQGGRTYNSAGTMVDASLSDTTQPQITALTKVFTTGSTINGVKLDHAWNDDIARYADGSIGIIWAARVAGTGTDTPDHRLMYARFNGTSWALTYLVKTGPKLYVDEQDYIGLGSLHPDDPHTIYISTTFDPRDDTTNLGKHEIFQGTTCDNGATWKWTPITASSTRDNLRPIVPKWDASHTALLWFRGTYMTAQIYNMAVVGVVSPL